MEAIASALLVEKEPQNAPLIPLQNADLLASDETFTHHFLEEFTEGLDGYQKAVLFRLLDSPDEQVKRAELIEMLPGVTNNSRNVRLTRMLYGLALSPFGDSLYTAKDSDYRRVYWFQESRQLGIEDKSIFDVYGTIRPYGPRIKPAVPIANFELPEALVEFLSTDKKSPLSITTYAELRFVKRFLQSLHGDSFEPATRNEVQSYSIELDDTKKTIFDRCNAAIDRFHKAEDAAKHAENIPVTRVFLRGAGVVQHDEDKEPSWQELGNCLGVDTDFFYPERGASTREAKDVCRSCAVQDNCLEEALAKGEKFGIWGGKSERERRRIRRQRRIARKAGAQAIAN